MKGPGNETARVAKNLTFSVAEYRDACRGSARRWPGGASTCWSSPRRRTWRRRCRNSETVRVTETGCEVLTRFDRRLFVYPDGG
jgi:hypothetical protein